MDEHHEKKQRRALRRELILTIDKGHGDSKEAIAKSKLEKRRLKAERQNERRKKAA